MTTISCKYCPVAKRQHLQAHLNHVLQCHLNSDADSVTCALCSTVVHYKSYRQHLSQRHAIFDEEQDEKYNLLPSSFLGGLEDNIITPKLEPGFGFGEGSHPSSSSASTTTAPAPTVSYDTSGILEHVAKLIDSWDCNLVGLGAPRFLNDSIYDQMLAVLSQTMDVFAPYVPHEVFQSIRAQSDLASAQHVRRQPAVTQLIIPTAASLKNKLKDIDLVRYYTDNKMEIDLLMESLRPVNPNLLPHYEHLMTPNAQAAIFCLLRGSPTNFLIKEKSERHLYKVVLQYVQRHHPTATAKKADVKRCIDQFVELLQLSFIHEWVARIDSTIRTKRAREKYFNGEEHNGRRRRTTNADKLAATPANALDVARLNKVAEELASIDGSVKMHTKFMETAELRCQYIESLNGNPSFEALQASAVLQKFPAILDDFYLMHYDYVYLMRKRHSCVPDISQHVKNHSNAIVSISNTVGIETAHYDDPCLSAVLVLPHVIKFFLRGNGRSDADHVIRVVYTPPDIAATAERLQLDAPYLIVCVGTEITYHICVDKKLVKVPDATAEYALQALFETYLTFSIKYSKGNQHFFEFLEIMADLKVRSFLPSLSDVWRKIKEYTNSQNGIST